MANSLLHERLTDHRRKEKPPCSCQVERAITSLRCSLLSGASLPASANFFRRTLGKEQQLPRVRSTTVPHRKARFRGLHVVDAGNLRTSSCPPSRQTARVRLVDAKTSETSGHLTVCGSSSSAGETVRHKLRFPLDGIRGKKSPREVQAGPRPRGSRRLAAVRML